MKYQTILVTFILFLMVLFAGLNWELFTTISTLNLLFTDVEAPLGIVMLIVIAAMSLIYLAVVSTIETSALVQSRRNTKELEKARKLAETEELSRYNDLRVLFEQELQKVDVRLNQIQEQLERSDIVKPIKNEEKGFFSKFKKPKE